MAQSCVEKKNKEKKSAGKTDRGKRNPARAIFRYTILYTRRIHQRVSSLVFTPALRSRE